MIQWWCAAQTSVWSWTWTAYPGVWLFVLAIAGGYLALRQRALRAGADVRALALKARYFGAGLALLWIAIDWPIGALGAGYLAWIHMVQFLLIAMAAPPLLLLGIPSEALPVLRGDGATAGVRRFVTHPLFALLAFNAAVVATHLPAVTDTLMETQLGSFAIDTLWLGAGLLYWWPVLHPGGVRPGFSPLVRMGYLFASMVFMTAPGAMITFSEFPVYGIYELAPRIGGFPALDDQRLAGLLMKVGGGAIVWIAISIMFYRWHREEKRIMDGELAVLAANELARR